ncbi:uncharacterized protein [Onthophagus taurus]|uniref:uncharacterized protein n=1 Tax=Onthophagus taurus TaxID=166361 RepID=UPI0039BE7B65
MDKTPSLNTIPPSILYLIFSFLTYSDVNKLRGTCKFLYTTCGSYLKKATGNIRRKLHQSMYEVNWRFLDKNLPLDERGVLLRAYNTLEILTLSLNTLVVLNRHILERTDLCFPIGEILDQFLLVINSMKKNMFGSWPTSSMHLHNKIRKFAENMEKSNPSLKLVIPMGVRAVDLLDMLMDTRYEICCIYDIPDNMCYITGTYNLADSRFLSYLPEISFISDCNDRILTEAESEIIMKYLVLLVNVHNGLLTKSEQYRRELEFSKRSLLHDNSEQVCFDHWFESLKCPKMSNFLQRKPAYRYVIDPKGEILEVYNNPIETNSIDDGVICSIQMKCKIDQAPLHIKESFDYLKNDIFLGDKSVEEVNSDIFQIKQSEIGRECYSATLKLAIRLPYNNKQMIDLIFRDGEILIGKNLPCI